MSQTAGVLQVDCTPPSDIKAKVVDFRAGQGGFIAIALLEVKPHAMLRPSRAVSLSLTAPFTGELQQGRFQNTALAFSVTRLTMQRK